MSAAKGILIRPSSQAFRIEAAFVDTSGNPVTTGSPTAKVSEVQTDGTLRAIDFSTTPPTVCATSATVPTTATIALNNQQCGGVARSYWSNTFTATNLTAGGVYLVEFQPPAGATTPNPKVLQFGSADGDEAPSASGVVPADIQTIKGQVVNCAATVTILASVGTATTSAAQSGDSYGRIGPNGSGLTQVTAATVADKTGYALSGAAVSAIVNDTADTIGADVVTITTGLATLLGRVPANVALAGSAPTWWVAPDNTDVATLVTSVGAGLGGLVTAIKTQTDKFIFDGSNFVKSNAQSLPSPAPTGYGGAAGSNVTLDSGTVAASPAPTGNAFSSSTATLHAASGDYVGMRALFQSGIHQGSWKVITGHTVTSGVHAFTFTTGWAVAPGNGDSFDVG